MTRPSEHERNEALIESRSILRETWPSLTDMDIAELPRSRSEAADVIHRKTGAPLDKIATTLSELFGLVPERHEVEDTKYDEE